MGPQICEHLSVYQSGVTSSDVLFPTIPAPVPAPRSAWSWSLCFAERVEQGCDFEDLEKQIIYENTYCLVWKSAWRFCLEAEVLLQAHNLSEKAKAKEGVFSPICYSFLSSEQLLLGVLPLESTQFYHLLG